MPSKAATAELAADGGATTMPTAPEGSADRVADPHEGEDITRPERGSIIPLGHAFCPASGHAVDWQVSPADPCADCGFDYRDHNPLFGQEPPAPGDVTVMATGYENGEAIDREVGPKCSAQEGLPGVGQASIWGDYQGHRLSHVQLAFGGGHDAPRDLAGKLKIGDRIHLLVTGYVANNGYQQDKDLIYFGKVRVRLDAVTVTGKRFVEDAMVVPEPPELIRKALVQELVTRADELLEDGGILAGDGTARVNGLIADLAHLFDPLPFEEDANSPGSPDSSPLSAALAEAMAEG